MDLFILYYCFQQISVKDFIVKWNSAPYVKLNKNVIYEVREITLADFIDSSFISVTIVCWYEYVQDDPARLWMPHLISPHYLI